jgi:hypothetical protein
MAYLNAQERERLQNELQGMTYSRAKGRLNRIDPNGRLVYWRNAQRVGEWHTRFDLPSLGTSVSLVEVEHLLPTKHERVSRRNYELVDVRVEPMPENQL